MDSLRDTYRAKDDDGDSSNNNEINDIAITAAATPDTETEPLIDPKEKPIASEDLSDDDDQISDNPQIEKPNQDEKEDLRDSPKFTKVSEDEDDDEDEEEPQSKKQKQLSSLTS
ncbi:hypothetical protein ACSBR1_022119 [Camellia fascicularis]